MFVLNGNADEITKLFRSFGLNEYESRVYFALQVCGKTKAGQLWKKAGIPQSKVYNVLDTLTMKGLVENVGKFPREAKAKPFLSSRDQRDVNELENSFGSLDFLYQSRNAFTDWSAQCDLELSNYKRTPQVRNFEREKRGVQKLFEKTKPDFTVLTTKMKSTLYALEIVEKTVVKKEVKLTEKIPTGAIEVITVEKSQPFAAMKRIESIFQSASGYVKILDKYVGEHTLDFVWKVPTYVPVQILCSVVEEKTKRTFEVGYKRLLKERLAKAEVRKCKPSEFHDRYIITQNELWHSGPSLKDLGITKWGIVAKIGNSATKVEIENKFDAIWKSSNELNFGNDK